MKVKNFLKFLNDNVNLHKAVVPMLKIALDNDLRSTLEMRGNPAEMEDNWYISAGSSIHSRIYFTIGENSIRQACLSLEISRMDNGEWDVYAIFNTQGCDILASWKLADACRKAGIHCITS